MIKQFESFGAYNQIKEWLDEFKIKNYTINDDLTVDVNGDVIIKQSDLEEIPIQFNNVYGSFDASDNRLTSLKGCPKYVKNMYLTSNKLTSLKGCPEYVDGELYLSYNRLANLNYSPKFIGGDFMCNENLLTSLKGCPTKINGHFNCIANSLSNLEGGPEYVGKSLYFSVSKLTTLKGFPKNVIGNINYNSGDLESCKLPECVKFFFFNLKIILENQDDYGIWNSDGSLNIGRWEIFYLDWERKLFNN